jgi:hypothetical protein
MPFVVTVAPKVPQVNAVEESDVDGILAFAERIPPRTSDLSSLEHKQRLQQLFFPEGIAFDGNRFNRTAATAPLFNYLAASESADERDGDPLFTRTRDYASASALLRAWQQGGGGIRVERTHRCFEQTDGALEWLRARAGDLRPRQKKPAQGRSSRPSR